MKILLVEDEAVLANSLAQVLRLESYAVDLAETGRAAEELMALHDYDLVLLDRAIPPPNGSELLRRWRDEGRQLPILMMTARGELEDRVQGLDNGADDYLVKPFPLPELLARIRSLLRRRPHPLTMTLRAGPIEMDRPRHQVFVGSRAIHLTPKEYGLLEYLLVRKGEVVSRAEIEEHVWDSAHDAMTNVVDVLVHRLRKKIGSSEGAVLLRTIPGAGYLLEDRPMPRSGTEG